MCIECYLHLFWYSYHRDSTSSQCRQGPGQGRQDLGEEREKRLVPVQTNLTKIEADDDDDDDYDDDDDDDYDDDGDGDEADDAPTWAPRLNERNLAIVADRLDVVRISEGAGSKNCSDTFGENLGTKIKTGKNRGKT